MKAKKLFSILLATVLILTQFAMLNAVFATGSSLSGRSDFAMGIHVNPSCIAGNSYAKTYDAILEAEALGANLIRTKLTNKVSGTIYGNEYDVGFADLAAERGMDMMFVAPFPYKDSEGNLYTADEIDIDRINEVYTAAATALAGKVAYYQIDNELNSIAILKNGSGQQIDDGTSASHFDQAQINAFAVGIYAVNKAIKAVDPGAKTIVNFTWKHVGFIDALLNVDIDTDTGRIATGSSVHTEKLDFDMIGLDWYSDMDHNSSGITYQDVITTAHNRHADKDIIICEADIRPKEYNGSGGVDYWDDASWIDTFARYCYAQSYVKGFCSFQLYDEPHYEINSETGEWTGVFNREAHHGVIDKNGNKKATYTVVQNLFGGTGTVADRTISAAPALNNEGTLRAVYQSTAVETTFPRVYSELEVFGITKETPVNFSNGNYVEFDLYVENAADFKAAMSSLGLYIDMFLYSGEDIYRDCRHIPVDYAVADGWNHFKISKAAFSEHSETDVDWTAINKVVLKFFGSDIDRYSEISGMKFAIANICSTSIDAPANVVNEGKIVIDAEGVSGTIGTKAGNFRGYYNRGYDTGMEEYSVWESAVDFSACQKIEFDLYVENLEIFNRVSADCNSGNGLILRLISDSGATKHRRFYLSKYVTKQGWNHIVIPIADFDVNNNFDTSTIRMYNLRFNQSSTQTEALGNTNYPAMYVAFKNFNGILADYNVAPDLPENRVVTTTDKVIRTLGTDTKKLNNLTAAFATPIDLSTSAYIEFDFYVENCAHFWEYQQSYLNSSSGGHGFCFYLSPNDTAPPTSSTDINYIRAAANKRIFLYFNDPNNTESILRQQITDDGWNHIKIPLSEWKTGSGSGFGTLVTDTSYFASISRIGVFNARSATTSLYKDEHIGFANLCGTGEEYSFLPELPQNVVAADTRFTKVGTYGDGSNTGIKAIAWQQQASDTGLDLSNADKVEFDLYVEDVEHFWDYQSTNMNSPNHYFCIFMSAERGGTGTDQSYITNSARVYYRFADLNSQITKDGWNHIVTNITDWNNGASGKATKSNFSSIRRIGFFTSRGSVTDDTHVYGDEHFGYANICGTVDLTVPTDVMSVKTDFIGATTKSIGFDGVGDYTAELASSADISGTRMFEIDVYVPGTVIDELEIKLVDGSGGYATYGFDSLDSGWNHLAVNLDHESEDGGLDLTDVAGYVLSGTASKYIIVSNFYAADYVDGDGNRDGEVDLSDYIHIKKYILTTDAVKTGNILAMDVKGTGTGLVGSDDLQSMRNYLLCGSWS